MAITYSDMKPNNPTMKSRLYSLLAAAFIIGSAGSVFAQGYDDDDDIYYNPSKAKSTKATTPRNSSYTSASTVEYPAADTYTPGTGVNIDVDTYNRRGAFAPDTAKAATAQTTGNFECTQQIERFYNPRIIIESPDADVATLYYSDPTPDVNIVINTPGYWGSTFYPYSPYYYSSPWYWGSPRSWWYYNSWAYDPWYYNSWAWGPSWSWGWGPSWSWGPSWGWGGYYPHRPGRPAWANRPSGNSRPVYRPGSSAGRHSYSGGYGNSRPGYRTSGTSRPSYTSPSYRPGQSGSGSNSGYRGNSRRSGSSSYSRPSNSSNRSTSSPSYRSGSGSSRGSAGSYGGGSHSGGSRGGGGGRGRH